MIRYYDDDDEENTDDYSYTEKQFQLWCIYQLRLRFKPKPKPIKYTEFELTDGLYRVTKADFARYEEGKIDLTQLLEVAKKVEFFNE